jgi:AcrR family transcriptional regulator
MVHPESQKDTNPPAKRGRPRHFDREQVLAQAMHVFWVSGFQGSSIHELSQSMGLAPASLYAAFGSKEALFEEAVALYLATEAEKSWQAFEQAPRLREGVRALLVETVNVLTHTERPRGCLLVLGDKGMSPSPDSVRHVMRQQRDLKREQLLARLQRALTEGEIIDSTDVDALAASVFIFMSGLSIETADGAPETRLLSAISEFMSRWPTVD